MVSERLQSLDSVAFWSSMLQSPACCQLFLRPSGLVTDPCFLSRISMDQLPLLVQVAAGIQQMAENLGSMSCPCISSSTIEDVLNWARSYCILARMLYKVLRFRTSLQARTSLNQGICFYSWQRATNLKTLPMTSLLG